MVEEIKQEAPLSIVEEARQERAKIEQVLEETKKLLNQNQEIQAQILLSGRAAAGASFEPPKQDTPKEYAEKVMKGAIKPL
jgi:hypothetical protein